MPKIEKNENGYYDVTINNEIYNMNREKCIFLFGIDPEKKNKNRMYY